MKESHQTKEKFTSVLIREEERFIANKKICKNKKRYKRE